VTTGIPAPQIRVDHASAQGARPSNEDFVGYCVAEGSDAARRGHVVAIADGMGGARGGRTAAEVAIHSLLDGYYSLPETHGVHRNAARAVETINGWLHAQGRADPDLAGAATTLTALVLTGRTAHVLHVGDTRAYHLSGGRLLQLTEDHTHGPGELRHVLYRAVGLEASMRLDHATIALREQDRLLLCSDGVHSVLGAARLQSLLERRGSPGEDARLIVDAALEAGASDNSTAVVVDVVALPSASPGEVAALIADLPITQLPTPGTTVDGFAISERLTDGRYSAVFAAVDRRSGRKVAIKFPKGAVASEQTYALAFVREAWIAGCVRSPYVAECIEVPADRRTCLYTVMPFYEGETLEHRLSRPTRVSLDEGVQIALALTRAAAALHRARIVHRDIKPDNILLERTGGLKLLDLGVARLPQLEELPAANIPGTPSYMAPELFRGEPGNDASDQFALGVTIYRMFSRRYPYGEIEPFQQPRFGTPTPLTEYRSDLPAWLEHLVGRAVSVDPKRRFGDVLELELEIENARVHGTPAKSNRRSLYERNPLLFWKIVSFLLLLALVWSLAR
jgi:serine/threonine protein phosphatase PrpC